MKCLMTVKRGCRQPRVNLTDVLNNTLVLMQPQIIPRWRPGSSPSNNFRQKMSNIEEDMWAVKIAPCRCRTFSRCWPPLPFFLGHGNWICSLKLWRTTTRVGGSIPGLLLSKLSFLIFEFLYPPAKIQANNRLCHVNTTRTLLVALTLRRLSSAS
jgi:hypothetical protein